MKVALSIPNGLFESAETLRKRMGVGRSHLYASALPDYIAKHGTEKITERRDAVMPTRERASIRPFDMPSQRRSGDLDGNRGRTDFVGPLEGSVGA